MSKEFIKIDEDITTAIALTAPEIRDELETAIFSTIQWHTESEVSDAIKTIYFLALNILRRDNPEKF